MKGNNTSASPPPPSHYVVATTTIIESLSWKNPNELMLISQACQAYLASRVQPSTFGVAQVLSHNLPLSPVAPPTMMCVFLFLYVLL